MKMRYVFVPLLLAPLLFGQVPAPDTPAGKVLAAWLNAFNSGDAGQIISFDDKYRTQLPPLAQTLASRQQTRGFTLLRIEKNEPLSLEAVVQEKNTGKPSHARGYAGRPAQNRQDEHRCFAADRTRSDSGALGMRWTRRRETISFQEPSWLRAMARF